MRRAFVVALFFVVAVPYVALAQGFDWRRVSPPGFNFSALFPGNPSEGPPADYKGPDGSVRLTSRVFQFKGGDYFCAVSLRDYSVTVDPDSELTADRDILLKTTGSTLLTSERGVFINGSDKLPELTFTFEMPEVNYRGKSIVVVKANRVYTLSFVFDKTQNYDAEMERFLGSFEILSTTQ